VGCFEGIYMETGQDFSQSFLGFISQWVWRTRCRCAKVERSCMMSASVLSLVLNGLGLLGFCLSV